VNDAFWIAVVSQSICGHFQQSGSFAGVGNATDGGAVNLTGQFKPDKIFTRTRMAGWA